MPVYGIIERQHIDHEAKLGDYYDASEDRFIRDSILKNSFILSSAKLTNVSYEDIQMAIDAQERSKLSMFGISPEMKLSIKVGLLETRNIMRDSRMTSRALKPVKGAIVFCTRVMESKFNIFEEGMEDHINVNSLRTTTATHYVSGIVFGTNTTVTVECQQVTPLTRDRVKKWLNDKLVNVMREIKGKPKIQPLGGSEGLDEENYEINIQISGSIEPSDTLQTFSDVVAFLKSLKGHPDTCKPVTYDLCPVQNVLSHLRIENSAKREFQEVTSDPNRAEGLEILLNELERVSFELEDLEDFVESAAAVCIKHNLIKEIQAYCQRFNTGRQEFLKVIKQAIISIRCKITEPEKIDEILDTFNNCEFSPSRVQMFLDEQGLVINQIEWFESLQKEGVEYVSTREKLTGIISMEPEVYAFCFGDFSEAWVSEEWAQKNAEFYQIVLNTRNTVCLIMEAEEYGNQEVINHYINGVLVKDKYDEFHSLEDLGTFPCLVRYNTPNKPGIKSKKRGFLTISCPGFLTGSCDSQIHRWHCEGCLSVVEYGYDGLLYCSCGRFEACTTSFKCKDPNHEGGFFEFSADDNLLSMLENIKPREEIVILILGETGVGKSTFINSLANYVTYSDLEDAETSDLIGLISTSFVVTDDEYEETKVEFGPKDENEVDDIGMSRTQNSRVYVFPYGDKLIKLIDTPGLGDNRGIEQDRKNSASILTAISQYPVIHGICILLKPNNARLSVIFSFCITELLCHLHKDASQNILFVFTNSRSTFYKPGDTLPALRETLKSIRSREPFVEIPLNKQTIFCIDNEAFRFLVALKNGIVFNRSDKENFSVSWMKSALEYTRLIERIVNMTPHKVSQTMSLNEARRLIISLSKPIGDITQHIQRNRVRLAQQRDKIKAAGEDIEKLEQALLIPKAETFPVLYKEPRTVCAGENCCKNVQCGDMWITEYPVVCHSPCYLHNITTDTIQHTDMQKCAAFDKHTGVCFNCKCHWEEHIHRTYELRVMITDQVDEQVKKELQKKVKTKEQIEKHEQAIERRKKQFEKEQDVITKTSAKFAYFLKRNAITPYNDALKRYLEHLINAQTEKSDQEPNKKILLFELQKMKMAYEMEIRVLETTMSRQSEATGAATFLTLNTIQLHLEELYSLELSGDIIREMIEGERKVSERNPDGFKEEEFVTVVPNKTPWATLKNSTMTRLEFFDESIYKNEH